MKRAPLEYSALTVKWSVVDKLILIDATKRENAMRTSMMMKLVMIEEKSKVNKSHSEVEKSRSEIEE